MSASRLALAWRLSWSFFPRATASVTFSGFRPDNLLRAQGDVNFYVDSNQYGFVEIAHHTLIQAVLDLNVIPKRPEV